MDRYEFNLKSQQMRKLSADGRYDEAALIADEIDWSRVKNTRLLMLTADIYEATKQPEKEYDILDIAYERSPMGKQLAYRLALVASELKEYEEAENYYKDYVDMAPHDSRRYLLRYRLSRARGEDLDLLIGLLERYLDGDMEERWTYELCELYAKAGYQDKCISLCDDLITWFGDGKYVFAALKLKKKYAPLSVSQQKKYEAMKRDAHEENAETDEEVGVEIARTRNEVLRNRTLPEKMQAVAERRMQEDAGGAEKIDAAEKGAADESKAKGARSRAERKAKSGAKTKGEKSRVTAGAGNSVSAKSAGTAAAAGNTGNGVPVKSAGTAAASGNGVSAKSAGTAAAVGNRENGVSAKGAGNGAVAAEEETEGISKERETKAADKKMAVEPGHHGRKKKAHAEPVPENPEMDESEGTAVENAGGVTRRYDGGAVRRAEAMARRADDSSDVFELQEEEESPAASEEKEAEEEPVETGQDFDVDEIHIKTYSDRAYDTMNIQAELAKSMEAILRTDEARGSQKAARRPGQHGSGPAVRTYVPPAADVAEGDPFGYEQDRREPEKQITGQMSIEEILKDLQTRGILKEDTVESALRVTGQMPLWKAAQQEEGAEEENGENAEDAESSTEEITAHVEKSVPESGLTEESVVKEMEEVSLRDFTTGEIDLEIVQNEVDERQKEKRWDSIEKPLQQEDVSVNPEASELEETALDSGKTTSEGRSPEEEKESPESGKKAEEEVLQRSEEQEAAGNAEEKETLASPEGAGNESAPESGEEAQEDFREIPAIVEPAAENIEKDSKEGTAEGLNLQNTERMTELSENDEEAELSEDGEEAEPSEDDEEAELSEDDEEAELSEDDEEAEPSEDDEEAELSEDDEEAEPSEDDEEAELSEDDEEAEPSEDDEEAELSEDDEEVEPSEDDEEAELSEDDEEAEPSEDDEEAELSEDDEEAELAEDDGEILLGKEAEQDRQYDTENFMSGLELDLARLGQEGNPYTQMRNEDVKRETEKMDDVFAVIREMETDLSEEDRIYNAYTEEEPKEKMFLDEVDRKEFEQYLNITGMESQIAKAINDYVSAYNNDGTSKNPNILITGGAKTGKSQLAVSLIRAINRHLGRDGRKTARISGFNLNRKTLSASMPRLVGNDLLIEHAGEINRKIVAELMDILPKYTGGMIVVMEDEKSRLDHLFEDYPLLADYFPNHLDIKEYDINEWAAVAKSYARSQGYTIDDLGTLALYAEIDALYGILQGLEVDDIKDIVDDAIEHSERKMGAAFARIFGKKKETGRRVLHETDFDA